MRRLCDFWFVVTVVVILVAILLPVFYEIGNP